MKKIYDLRFNIYYFFEKQRLNRQSFDQAQDKWSIVNSQLQSAFTLVELLLYMGIFVILLSVFIQLFGSLLSTQLSSQASSSVSADAKYLLARFTYDISRSQNIISPLQGISASGITLVINNAQYVYALSSGNIVLTANGSSDQLNSNDTTISNLTFTPLGSSSGKYTVKIQATITSVTTSHGRPETETIQTTIGNR